MSARSEGGERARGGSREASDARPVQEERFALLRSTFVLNPGIPHFVDFPAQPKR